MACPLKTLALGCLLCLELVGGMALCFCYIWKYDSNRNICSQKSVYLLQITRQILLDMVTAKELQSKIIDLVYESSDIGQLTAIYQDVKSKVRGRDYATSDDLPWQHALADVKTELSFEELIRTQGTKSLDFDYLRALSEEVAWESTLDELLEMLD